MTRCDYCGSREDPVLADPPNDAIGAWKCLNCGCVWVERVVPREYVASLDAKRKMKGA